MVGFESRRGYATLGASPRNGYDVQSVRGAEKKRRFFFYAGTRLSWNISINICPGPLLPWFT
jgi:hypothetical protein